MLYIRQNDGLDTAEWHVGESMPPITSRVVIFQADGEELDVILGALIKHSKKVHLSVLERRILKEEYQNQDRTVTTCNVPTIVALFRQRTKCHLK